MLLTELYRHQSLQQTQVPADAIYARNDQQSLAKWQKVN